MNKDKISIIVSCYNTEKYIKKCVESLINQSYKNLEIILIDDGSSDNTLKIIKEYENENKKIKVIENVKNRGLAYSRNVGLNNSTGIFVGFIDSDDYIDKDYYKNLITAIKNEKADLAICDMKLVYENGTEHIVRACEQNCTKLDFINNGLAASACNKLFKKEILIKYPFEEGKVNEDLAVVLPSIVAAKKIAYVKDTFYNYLQREKSIQNSRFSDRRFEIFDGVETTLNRLLKDKNYNKYKDAIIYNQIIVLFIYVIPKESNIIYRRNIIKKFVKLAKKYKIRKNEYFWNFINCQGKKHQIYYKTMFKLAFNNCYLLTSLLILLVDIIKRTQKVSLPKIITNEMLINLAKKQQLKKEPKKSVSVVIPNYNYSEFLNERLYTILYQKIKLKEIIILDDCSTDNSCSKINELVKCLSPYIKIKSYYNKKNSGTPFKQWQKGFSFATGDYVWIAEADDLCKSNLISKILKPCIKNPDINISYADTAFINKEKNLIMKTIKPEIDIQRTNHWEKSYINDGLDEIKNYSFLNCTIANVSSCIIKNNDYDEYLKQSIKYRQAGDWLFYVNVLTSGKIAYTNLALNYYRVHGDNVSSTMNQQKHLEEIKEIHSYYLKKFNLSKDHKKKMQERIHFLEKNWNLKHKK